MNASRSSPHFTPQGTSDVSQLILKRALIGWNQDDFNVLENGVVVGRIFFLDAVGPQGRPWMWASGHNGEIRRAAHGYEPTREAAMAAFGKCWRRNRAAMTQRMTQRRPQEATGDTAQL
jgi:hypothetical protein